MVQPVSRVFRVSRESDSESARDRERASERKILQLSAAIGKRIRIERKRLGMSARELGLMVELTGDQIMRLERGERNLLAGRIYLISLAMGIPINYLFDGIAADAGITMDVVASADEADSDKAELVSELSGLVDRVESPQSRALLLALIEELPGGRALVRVKRGATRRDKVKWQGRIKDPP